MKSAIQEKLRRLVDTTMREFKATLLTEKDESEEFDYNAKIRQRDGLSAALFNLAIDALQRVHHKQNNINSSIRRLLSSDMKDRRSLEEATILKKQKKTNHMYT